jgi:putative flippase GtrA
VIGGFVGLLTVAARELIGWLLVRDSPSNYSLSIGVAYALGIFTSFELNRRFTFASAAASRHRERLLPFVLCAIASLLCTWLLALLLRYGLSLDALIGRAARLLAFALATLICSLGSYFLNARYVFRPRPLVNSTCAR